MVKTEWKKRDGLKQLIIAMEEHELLKDILGIKSKELNRYIPFVKRFSFDSLMMKTKNEEIEE